MLRLGAALLFCPLVLLVADDAAKPREESMRSDRFADAHAPLFARRLATPRSSSWSPTSPSFVLRITGPRCTPS